MRGIHFVLLTNQFKSKQIRTHHGAALFSVQETPNQSTCDTNTAKRNAHDVCGSHEGGQVKRKSRMARSKKRMEEKVTSDSDGEDYYRTEGERMKKAKAAIVSILSARVEKTERSKAAMDRKEQEMEMTRMKEKWEKLHKREEMVLEGLEVVREESEQLKEERERIQKEMENIQKEKKRQITRESDDLRRPRVQVVSYRQTLGKEGEELREERLEMKELMEMLLEKEAMLKEREKFKEKRKIEEKKMKERKVIDLARMFMSEALKAIEKQRKKREKERGPLRREIERILKEKETIKERSKEEEGQEEERAKRRAIRVSHHSFY
ncbi:uncharacterized protein [Salvelinus alpinus]|uniref:uncharacterized protein isoform X1 n=2 Tax=Salvelinus alpinus TaxID=8036 RepID=UPI0039FD71AC